jgi:YbbR domain-containing protein
MSKLLLILKHNWPWKLICLAGALAAKVYVTRQQDALRQIIDQPIPIVAPPGQHVEEPAGEARVRIDLQGPAELMQDLQDQDVVVKVETSTLKPGVLTTVPVHVELSPKLRDRVVVLGWKPTQLPVKLASDVTKTLSVRVRVLRRLPDWEFRTVPTTVPEQVVVRGAKEDVDRVATVEAGFFPEPTEHLNETVAVQAMDADGHLVTTVQLSPPQVLVNVLQERVVLEKDVPVQPLFSAPPGRRVTVTVFPTKVRLTGPKAIVGEIYVVETPAVVLAPGQAKVSKQVMLAPPRTGVEVKPRQVTVTLSVQPQGRPVSTPPGRPRT